MKKTKKNIVFDVEKNYKGPDTPTKTAKTLLSQPILVLPKLPSLNSPLPPISLFPLGTRNNRDSNLLLSCSYL